MAPRSPKKSMKKKTSKGKVVADLLKQLKAAGARVTDIGRTETASIESLKSRSQITASALKELRDGPAMFGAWLSWTKRF